MKLLACITIALLTVLAPDTQTNAEQTWCSQNPGGIFCCDFDRNCVSPPADPNETCPDGSPRSDPRLRSIWKNNSWNYNTSSFCGSDMCGEELPSSPIPGIHYGYILPSHPYGGRHANGGDEGGALGQNTVDLTDYVMTALPGHTVANGSDSEPLVLTFTMGSLALGAMQFNNGYMELGYGDPDRWSPVDDPAKAPTNFVLVGADDGDGCTSCSSTCPPGSTSQSQVSWPTICQQEFPHALCPPKQTVVRNSLAIGALALLDNNPCHCCTVGYVNPNQPWRSQCVAADRNPDFPDGWQEPTNVHLSFFDGLQWRVLKAGMGGPGSYGDFRYGNYWIYLITAQGLKGNTDGAWETVVLTIKTNTVDVYHKTKMVNMVDGQWVETWAVSLAKDLPRHYTGGFNRLRAGTDESCQLNNDTHTCNTVYANGLKKCKVMKEGRCNGGNATYRASYVAFDNIGLFGGEGNLETGACCTSNGNCTETDPVSCVSTLGGAFRGANTTCDNDAAICRGACCRAMGTCEDNKRITDCVGGKFRGYGSTCQVTGCDCPDPFADVDWDGDVDQIDFAVLQSCFQGSDVLVGGLCRCFDRSPSPYPSAGADGDVDKDDLDKFELCASGPGIPYNPTCDQQ